MGVYEVGCLILLFLASFYIALNQRFKERFKAGIFAIMWVGLFYYMLRCGIDAVTCNMQQSYVTTAWTCFVIAVIHTIRYNLMNPDA